MMCAGKYGCMLSLLVRVSVCACWIFVVRERGCVPSFTVYP